MAVIDLLLDGLKNPDPTARIAALRVLATIEETQALPALRAMMQSETHPDVIHTLKWVGSTIWKAQQNGYSTEAAIRQFFRLDLAQTEEEKREAAKLAEVQERMELERIKEQQGAPMRQLGSSLTMGALGTVMGGPMMGASMMMSSALSGLNNPSSGLEPRPGVGTQPIAPQRPSDVDISAWVRRLNAADNELRKKAMIELRHMNNPAALTHLAAVFVLDPDPPMKEMAQQSAKAIYYNCMQWETELAKGKANAAPAQPQSQQDIADILEKARAAKEKRKSRTS